MWEKIVLNLVSNALKSTFDGRDQGFHFHRDDAGARLTVADTGTGIPGDELPHYSSDSGGWKERAAAATKAPESAWRW